MNDVIDYSDRRLVVITDPHIKIDTTYDVYANGLEQEVFIRSRIKNEVFEGECWPGPSSWVDFMNPKGYEYWKGLYSKFKGTSSLYGIWIDMNEPSVQNREESTMPKVAISVVEHGERILHKDYHNMYGLMMAKATYEGLLERDNGTLRPFLLTRSAFLGS
jgi:alpha-glucosidase (family GH31 glycosyl hydrolase)